MLIEKNHKVQEYILKDTFFFAIVKSKIHRKTSEAS